MVDTESPQQNPEAARPEPGAPAVSPPEAQSRHTCALVVLLSVYVALSLRFLTLLPLWGGVHDEPIHFGYCKYLALVGHLPPLRSPNSTDMRFYYTTPSAGEAAHHPPGYYALGSLVCRLLARSSLATQNYALRGLSLALGLTSLILLYLACRQLLPAQPLLALAVVALVAAFPQWLMMSSVIYVETFGAAAVAGATWLLARYARDPRRRLSLGAAGACIGFMSLTKATLLPFCLAATATAALLIFRAPRPRGQKIRDALACVAPLVLVAGWWYVRNLVVYGRLVPTSVVAGQLDTAIRIAGRPADMLTLLFSPPGRLYYRLALTGAFRYFWCPGDWLPPAARPVMYPIAALTWILLPISLWRGRARRDPDLAWVWPRFGLPLLCGLALFFFLYVRWTVTTAIQAHGEFGKFLMPLLGPFVCLLALGLKSWWGSRPALALLGALVLFFLLWDALAVYHLTTVLIPRYGALFPPP